MDTRFPSDFLWGAGTSSYQIEGAALGCGKEESIWDRFCQKQGAIQNGDTGASAADHYRLWETDVELLKQLKVNSYRFSISWPRFFPSGKVNPEGKAFYDRLIDRLLEAKIEPMVTLYHWDLPQSLEDRGGWPERKTAEAFSSYAFGSRRTNLGSPPRSATASASTRRAAKIPFSPSKPPITCFSLTEWPCRKSAGSQKNRLKSASPSI
jgi:hypothetical protein